MTGGFPYFKVRKWWFARVLRPKYEGNLTMIYTRKIPFSKHKLLGRTSFELNFTIRVTKPEAREEPLEYI